MFAENGTELGTVAVKRDWEPLYEFTRLHFLRRGELALDGDGGASVLPVWDGSVGEPYCRGYRMEIAQPGRRPVALEFPNRHFRDFARTVASAFVEERRLAEGERFTYLVVAQQAPLEPRDDGGLQIKSIASRTLIREGSLDGFLARATTHDAIDQGNLPVFVAAEVLEQARSQTRCQEGTETGGILIGSLWHDARSCEIFAEITAQIPAEHTAGTAVKLTFTPQTWAAADAALRLRGRGETYLGYWHSHPVRAWCKAKNCTLESQRVCRLARDFFSADDEAVMRAAFPRAWCVGIVANDTAFADVTFSMFGNLEGTMQARGFYILGEGSNGT